MLASMLTTVDNPYDPFDDFDDWYAFDTRQGYHSLSLLDRVVVTSEETSEADQANDIENAIDEIVRENVLGLYRKVTREISEEAYNILGKSEVGGGGVS